ncbi:hypothetical protein D6817_00650 [Candidatus Pacearchaeota archaeon]|nr:MAG: hypothetical protein D6817_00650 [Candidatus Pacearchaeota archaeon]
MANWKAVVAGVALLAVVLFVGFRLTGNASKDIGKYDEFAKCLTDKGVTMYGAYWCPHCARQKEMFGSSWKYVNYVECDPRGNNAKPELCREKGVQGFPTWEFPNGEIVSGETPLRELSFRSGCPLPQ